MSKLLDSIPADRTKKEHIGFLEKVIWCDDEKPVSILALTDGKSVVVDAESKCFVSGQRYRFLGRWDEGKRGPQFKASTFVRDNPHTKTAVVKYLGDVCEGVGTKLAEKLWNQYGPEAVQTLREKPEQVAADGVMSADAAETAANDLRRYAHLEATRIDLFGLFASRGFPAKLVERAIAKWGVRAPHVVRSCPFRLLSARLPGCGWKRCDRMYLDMGKRPNALKRQALAGWNALREDRTGSTWVAAEVVVAAIRAAVPNAADPVKAVKLGVRAGLFGVKRIDKERWIAVGTHARAEQRVADALARLNACPVVQWPTALPVSAAQGDGLPSSHQVEQLLVALSRPVGCFTGGPGTGKTHSLAFAIQNVIERFGSDAVAVCAPTGKAADRATESLAARGIRIRATTIHQLLEIGRNGHDGSGWGFHRNRDNPLEQRFIIVDESSMIDTTLMADLLDACSPPSSAPGHAEISIPAGGQIPPACRRCSRPLTDPASWEIGYGPTCAKLVPEIAYAPVEPRTAQQEVVISAVPEMHFPGTHVLFVGDPFQLPPVGHGAPLRDMIAAGVPTGELTEVRRNAGAIVRACSAIKAGDMAAVRNTFCDTFNLDADDPDNLRFIECHPSKALDVVEQVLRNVTKFDPCWDAEIIVAINEKSDLSRKSVNERFAKALNPDGRRVAGIPFAVNDKVICLKNSKLPTCEFNDTLAAILREDSANYAINRDAEAFCANGQIGRVAAVGRDGMVVALGGRPNRDERLVWVPKSKPKAADEDDADTGREGGAMGDWDQAWGITCHKGQGSEWPLVLVLADKAGGSVADRNWWYTAISRAKVACLVIGDRAAFETQCKRAALVRRKTFLVEAIQETAGIVRE